MHPANYCKNVIKCSKYCVFEVPVRLIFMITKLPVSAGKTVGELKN